mmetsp:Transcript_24163/g.61148  ORF Transcript_24163/g.61148 Transcript_24163/m.61148 type:complete len:249 (-) Transcript_24163:555-1301(-)
MRERPQRREAHARSRGQPQVDHDWAAVRAVRPGHSRVERWRACGDLQARSAAGNDARRPRQAVGHLRRPRGRHLDREHEHCARRQQEALPHVGRDHQDGPLADDDVRGRGPLRRLARHRQSRGHRLHADSGAGVGAAGGRVGAQAARARARARPLQAAQGGHPIGAHGRAARRPRDRAHLVHDAGQQRAAPARRAAAPEQAHIRLRGGRRRAEPHPARRLCTQARGSRDARHGLVAGRHSGRGHAPQD